ncbi:MAG: alpha/beta hydrolase [Sulfitobacter sp.]|nr:alpha/beta hydrolase [Sulfitobacter sp.]
MREETVELGGRPFHVRHWGDETQPKLLMLHGFPEYGGAFAPLAEHLSQRFHCMAPDQRGFGQSWAPDDVSAYRTSELVGDMAALIGEAPCHVLGHDWGAAVAYGLAMFRPELVRRLIIMNGVHPVPFQRAMAAGGAQTEASQYINYLRREGSEDRLAEDGFARLMALFSAKMDLDWLTEDLRADYLREWSRPGRLKTMIHWYRASPLRVAAPGEPITDLPDMPVERLQVRCPHLLIWGQDDTALLPEATEGLEEFAGDLTRVEIAGVDHWLHHQRPAEVAEVILGWLPKG